MKAQSVFENLDFERGQDSKKAMDLGMKTYIVNKVKELTGTEDIDLIDEVIDMMAQDKGGAFEMYLPAEKKEELYWLFKLLGKGKIKAKGFDVLEFHLYSDGDDDLAFDRAYNKMINPLLKRGWEIWHEETNMGFIEYILVKYI